MEDGSHVVCELGGTGGVCSGDLVNIGAAAGSSGGAGDGGGCCDGHCDALMVLGIGGWFLKWASREKAKLK